MSKKLCCWTSVLLSCAAIAAHAEEGITLSIEMLNWQKSCPVQIVAVNTAKVGWFINDALVLNTTQSDVQEIQLGLVLSRSNGDNLNQRRLRTFIGYRVPVAIAPGEAVATGPQLWTVGAIKNEVKTFGKGGYVVTIGVVGLTFADGSTLTYNPEVDFRQEEISKADEMYQRLNGGIVSAFTKEAAFRAARMYERSQEIYRSNPAAVTPLTENGNGGYFSCASTVDTIYCTNNYTSCTMTSCPTPSNCPKQKCQYHS